VEKGDVRFVDSLSLQLFPSIQEIIEEDSPKNLCFTQESTIDWDQVNHTFTRFMVKDYVKSVKDTAFPTFFETPVDPDAMNKQIASFIELRGNLYTGGIIMKTCSLC
jgi:hypothetical protein